MGKKRKGGARQPGNEEAESAANDDARLAINTFEDVADSEDEFQMTRDKILLEEGPAQKKRRQIQEEEQLLEPSDEEVLPVDDEAWSSSAEDDLENADRDVAFRAKNAPIKNLKPTLQDSADEELDADRQDEGEEGWGSSKKDYYDADVIETEADALEEEAEAMRLQQSQLQDMTAADFGFDEAQWLQADQKEEEADGVEDGVRRKVLPEIEISDALDPQEKIAIMQTRYPEFEPLAREFLDLQDDYDELAIADKEAIRITRSINAKEGSPGAKRCLQKSESIASLKYRALSAYLGALSMYFALLTSGNKQPDGKITVMAPEHLREHAIMETLIECRDLWKRIKDVPLPENHSDEQEINAAVDHPVNGFQESMPSLLKLANTDSSTNSYPNPAEQLLSKHQKKRVRKAERLALAAQEEALARQRERLREAEMSLESLPDFTKKSNNATAIASLAKKSNQVTNEDDDSDFGEATSLTAYEVAEKAKRKKSLKFYTSQIAQKSNKRDGAGRDAGGDTDLPYRERLRDRQERLRAEAERRGEKAKLSTVGVSMGQDVSEEEAEQTNSQRQQNEDAADSDDDDYDQIVKRASDKKALKASKTKAYEAAMNGAHLDENNNLEASGKRAITYAIEKNKGLHPHRKKDVRNPRVKKRKKYEDKQKKLKNMRAVYKPEREGPGGYGGEMTGIKKNLVKSVKL